MSNDWLSKPDAKANIKRLLTQMGIPLETRVASICQDFDRWSSRAHYDMSMSSGRLLYGDSSTDVALREVDHGVSVWTYVDIGTEENDLTTTLEIIILIECKHRDELAIFGFPYQSRRPPSAVNPIFSDLAYSSFMKDIAKSASVFTKFASLPICTIGLLDNMNKSPRVSDEHLIYKAGASLYDCIRFMETPLFDTEIDPLIQEMGLIETFKEYLQTPFYNDIWSSARSWMHHTFTEEMYESFNKKYFSKKSAYMPSISIYVPIVCVDAPLYTVAITGDGEIQDIEPEELLLTAIRIPRWPGGFHYYLLRPSPEALVTVVNVDYLPIFLDDLADWFSNLITFLSETENESLLKQIPLEMCFLRSIINTISPLDQSGKLWRV
jgi:hypothetical protein